MTRLIRALALIGAIALAPCLCAGQDSAAVTGESGPGAAVAALGAGFGTPGGITGIGGVFIAPLAVRVSGGYWGKQWNGFQGDIGVLLNSSPLFAHGISLVGGVFRVNPLIPDNAGVPREQSKMVHYVGAAYDAYLGGFFLQIGLAHGRGDYPDPQLLVQCAYLFTF